MQDGGGAGVSLPKEPKTYDFDRLASDMQRLISAFQAAFHRHLTGKSYPVMVDIKGKIEITRVPAELIFPLSLGVDDDEIDGVRILANPSEVSTWSYYEGYLANAVKAARQLRQEYDVGIGIAKKGMWLSFIFSEFGMPSYDLLVCRDGTERFTWPIDDFYSEMLEGKKILLLENDAVTGTTVTEVVNAINARVSPEFIDLLLISRYTHLDPEFFEEIKDKMKEGQVLGRGKTGKVVIDTFKAIPKSLVRKKMALETDFRGKKKDLKKLGVRLGV